MLHTILSWMAGFLTLGGFQYTRNYIKSRQEPINLINGIVLPAVDDPEWHYISSSTKLHHSRVNIAWDIGQSNDPDIFDGVIKTTQCHIIATKKNAFAYVKAVRYHHMKYMVECPEIKNLDSLSSSKQLNANS